MRAEELCSGMVKRLLGEEYTQWFDFRIEQEDADYYRIFMENGKIVICGQNGVSVAAGLKFYLKKFCGVYIGQQVIQKHMPLEPIKVEKEIYRKAKSRIRYAYNYCTLSYSMPFWDQERWQRELDYLALSGVNLVLDFTGIEEVWYRFLTELGYTDEEIRRWIVGPCYTAWQQMQNIESYGGPVPRKFFEDRADMARKNQSWMQAMGMEPVRQGYSGMVPSEHKKHEPSAVVYQQGMWNGFTRPGILDPTSELYRSYAEKFYRIQEEVYGIHSSYYAVDVFHEGGIRPKTLNDTIVAQEVLKTMLKHDPQAVWVIQAWRENPTEALLKGIHLEGKEHALILDLSATDNPMWKKSEFQGTPWVYCMLDMYGGRVSVHGEPDVIAKEIPLARKKADHMEGIGFASEATLHNPLVFDLLFDMVWEEDAVDLEAWVREWLQCRYGEDLQTAYEAWKGLLKTAYKNPGYSHHGGYTQIFTFRPNLDMKYGEVFNELGSTVIKSPYYDTKEFESAVFLLAECRKELQQNEAFCYDMQDLLRQVLNNRACDLALGARDAWLEGKKAEFKKKADTFFELFDACDRLMRIRKDTTLADWTGYARKAGKAYDAETEKLFVWNARKLITTWGDRETYESLADYAYRQYGGLLKAYYRPRWKYFFEEMREISTDEWYEMAEEFVISGAGEDETILSAETEIQNVLQVLQQTERSGR